MILELNLEEDFYVANDVANGSILTLPISDAQKLLFPADFKNSSTATSNGTLAYSASVELGDTLLTGAFGNAVVSNNLADPYSANNDYWTLFFTVATVDNLVYGTMNPSFSPLIHLEFLDNPVINITATSITERISFISIVESLAIESLRERVSLAEPVSSVTRRTIRSMRERVSEVGFSETIAIESLRERVSDVDYNGNYLAVVYHTQTGGFTSFNNMPFNGSCLFNGKTLFFNESGLFEYGANNSDVLASIKTDKMNLDSQHRKRSPSSKVYVNAEKSADLTLTVTVDDTVQTYSSDEQQEGLAVYPVPIGHGFDGVHWQLEVSGCDTIESVEIELEEIRRRGR